ncbi:Sog2 protein [Martiniozyma asiatica (nom. inval.)]|nr:Sog2 protein [Martiniozyma asiatica]
MPLLTPSEQDWPHSSIQEPLEESSVFRSRSLSESLRSSRAEKRMGRLFKQPKETTEEEQENEKEKDVHFYNQNTISKSNSSSSSSSRRAPFHETDSSYGLDSNHRQQSSLSSTDESDDQHQFSFQPKYKTREGVITLSTLPEVTSSDKHLPLVELILVAKKFRLFYDQLFNIIQELGTKLSIPRKEYQVFLNVLETVEKRAEKKEHENVMDSIASHLSVSMISCMKELKTFVENLKLSLVASDTQIPSDSIKMVYYALFSLFTELVTICKLVIPIKNPIEVDQKKSVSTSSKSRPSFFINRVAAPNPALSSQSAPVQARQNSRTFSITRQEIDSSSFSTPIEGPIESDVLFNLINHTTQAAQVVFSQLNTAISKSAINTAQSQNESLEFNHQQNQPVLNNIAAQVKELTVQCMGAMERTRKVKAALQSIMSDLPSSKSYEEKQRSLYDQTNLFLKSIIGILAATKAAMQNLPALNEVRSAMGVLTRATKELTITLESSLLKNSVIASMPSNANLVEQPPLSAIPSMSNFQGPMSAVVASSPMIFSDLPNPPVSANNASTFAASMRQQSRQANSNMRQDMLETKSSSNALDSMQQHIKKLQQSSTKNASDLTNSSLSVTTPLIASIGPAVASAVLPISSPLKTGDGIIKSQSNSNINAALNEKASNTQDELQNQIKHPIWNQQAGTLQETNPFDKYILQGPGK